MASIGVNDGTGHGGGFFWQGGGAQITTQNAWSSPSLNSPYFGWQLVCGLSTCGDIRNFASLSIFEIELIASETAGPAITAIGSNNLWYADGWVRGSWPISMYATDPSGVCSSSATVNGQLLNGPSAVPRQNTWHQCPDLTWTQTINTVGYGQGAMPLTLRAANAAYDYTAHAYVSSTASRTIYVDNAAPTLSLAGPTDAPSTAGVQYVDAAASAGPSGVSGISCSVDGGSAQLLAGSSARVAVAGVGVHHLSCVALNNARDSSGALGSSGPSNWTLSIREPSVASVSFAKEARKLRCRRVREKIRIPGQWVTVRVHGQPVRVHVPAQTKVRIRLRCKGRTISRAGSSSTKRVRFGEGATLSGWLGTSSGDALGGQRVRIMAAPDNGSNQFQQEAEATTGADGTWSVRLPGGPSRIVVAAYGGSASVEPTLSAAARLIVPASVRLKIIPVQTHWGGTIRISGRLRGGYVPPAGELIVLHVGWSGGSTEIGHVYTGRDGRFTTRYTFLRGNGSETYHLWATTAAESDYPFAPSASRKIPVSVASG